MLIGFYETFEPVGIIRLDDIERISEPVPNKWGTLEHKVILRSGRIFNTLEAEKGGLLRRPVQIIPAEPGTSIIRVDTTDMAERWVGRTPLIAWALCLDGEIRPVTPNGVNDGLETPIYVEMPNGQIESVGEHADPCMFADVDAMKRHYYGPEAAEASA